MLFQNIPHNITKKIAHNIIKKLNFKKISKFPMLKWNNKNIAHNITKKNKALFASDIHVSKH